MPVTYEKQGPVAVLTMDDGKANAITREVVDEFGDHLDRIDADDDIRAVLVTGRPGRFSAGFDLAAMTSSRESMKDLVMAGGRLAARILVQPRPVIAACTGHALAMGALLLLTADHRVGPEGEWKVGLNEVAIGMPMPRWGVELGRYRISPAHIEWRMVLGQVGGPEDAVAAGFLDRLVPADQVVESAFSAAQQLAQLRTGAVGGTKSRLRAGVVERMLSDMEADLEGVTVPEPA